MNQFKMSLFLPPISPVKDSATGRTVQPPTLTPYKEITLQEVYKLITSSERLKTLTETVRRAAENGDEKAYRMLKQQTLPYVTPCGVFSYRKSDSLTGPSGLIVVDIDHLDSRGEAEKAEKTTVRRPPPAPCTGIHQPRRTRSKSVHPLRPGTHTRHQTEYLRKHPLGDELRTSNL